MNCELCDRECVLINNNFTCKCGGNSILYYNYQYDYTSTADSGLITGLSKTIIISYKVHDDFYIDKGKDIIYIGQNWEQDHKHNRLQHVSSLCSSRNGILFGSIDIIKDLPDLPTKELVEYCKSLLLFI